MQILEIYVKITLGEFETFLTHVILDEKNKTTGENLMKKQGYSTNVRAMTRGALIAALYVVLTYLANAMGLASGVIQFRISEALCILPIFMPEAIAGLFIGCFISNMVTGCLPWDIVFGSLATLIGALGAYYLRTVPNKYIWLPTLPTIVANAIIVPPVLITVYGSTDSYFFILLTVTIGEVVCAGILGTLLGNYLKQTHLF